MDQPFCGREAKTIVFENHSISSKKGYTRLVGRCIDCGERVDYWILQVENGQEKARHNAKYIETIVWK